MTYEKQSIQIEIHNKQYDWLLEMVQHHSIDDIGKAIRILIDYATTDGDSDEIFGYTRCNHC
tara:strand:+ start:847 stop:1032 length:186 start_codon:yes stop_codon:yes gene_type:complete